eukprot:gene25206-217_t
MSDGDGGGSKGQAKRDEEGEPPQQLTPTDIRARVKIVCTVIVLVVGYVVMDEYFDGFSVDKIPNRQ